jgi:translation initiation factor 2 subunit 2
MDYEDQLDRALEAAPEVTEARSRFEVPAPEVRQEGNVTVYENFAATCDRLNREPESVLKYLQSTLGTSASIDETGRARLTGSFDGPRVAATVEDYVDEFVTCPECGSPDTHLVEERGATLLKCDACGARSPVPEH